MPRTFGSLSAYEPGLMDKARWWLQDTLTPVMGGDARRAGDFVQNKVMPTAEYLPGVGDAMAAGEAVDYFKQGQPIFGTLAAAGAAAGFVPGVGDAVQKGIKAAVKSRGDEVLGLLKAGRADEVTDDMLDMGNAADNANLNAYLFENYDLPMDEASRMGRAQEMGFDTERNLYHGTPDSRDLKAQGFKTTAESTFGKGERRGPYFATDNRAVAKTYADDRRAFDYQNAEPEVLDILLRSEDPISIDAAGAKFRGIDPDKVYAAMREKYGEGPLLDNVERALKIATSTSPDGKLSTDQLNSVIKRFGGSDRIDVKNVIDTYNGVGPKSTVSIFSDPSQARLKSARFDPRLKHLRNLSAGLAPFGALSMFNAYQDDNYQHPQL